MQKSNSVSRRFLVKSSVLGVLSASLPNIVFSKNFLAVVSDDETLNAAPHDRYPSIRLSVASEVVASAHFNLERLKELVDPRPELAKAEWDWGFGDWESAIAAASHVGRRDIIEYLINKGAVPTIFTFAVLGEFETVKSVISAFPGIQKNFGPHGISLLQHAKTALDVEGTDKSKARQMIDYLQSLGDSDGRQYLNMEDAEKSKYLGDYKYGEGREDGFTIKLNMRKLISLGRLGKSGGSLLRISENEFTYQGAPSVTIKFKIQNEQVIALEVREPGLVLTAKKI